MSVLRENSTLIFNLILMLGCYIYAAIILFNIGVPERNDALQAFMFGQLAIFLFFATMRRRDQEKRK